MCTHYNPLKKYLHVKENRKYIPIMPLDLKLWLTLISTNYSCLEHIFIVPKVFEPLKFYCIWAPITPMFIPFLGLWTYLIIYSTLTCIYLFSQISNQEVHCEQFISSDRKHISCGWNCHLYNDLSQLVVHVLISYETIKTLGESFIITERP